VLGCCREEREQPGEPQPLGDGVANWLRRLAFVHHDRHADQLLHHRHMGHVYRLALRVQFRDQRLVLVAEHLAHKDLQRHHLAVLVGNLHRLGEEIRANERTRTVKLRELHGLRALRNEYREV